MTIILFWFLSGKKKLVGLVLFWFVLVSENRDVLVFILFSFLCENFVCLLKQRWVDWWSNSFRPKWPLFCFYFYVEKQHLIGLVCFWFLLVFQNRDALVMIFCLFLCNNVLCFAKNRNVLIDDEIVFET